MDGKEDLIAGDNILWDGNKYWGPNFWGREIPKWEAAIAETNTLLHTLADPGCHAPEIDEVALMFPDVEGMDMFLKEAVSRPDVEFFNSAFDKVITAPLQHSYEVEYNFLRMQDRPFRIECMVLREGVSPLHTSLLQANQWYPQWPKTVHLSFKCMDEQEYELWMVNLSRESEMVQRCESTYGLFSYWKVPGFYNEYQMYVKPRLNMRDSDDLTTPETEEERPEADAPSEEKKFGFPGIGGKWLQR